MALLTAPTVPGGRGNSLGEWLDSLPVVDGVRPVDRMPMTRMRRCSGQRTGVNGRRTSRSRMYRTRRSCRSCAKAACSVGAPGPRRR